MAALVALMFAANAFAQAPVAESGASADAASPMSAEELEQLVAPIALYPDDLVAIILPSATYPLQIVQADRFLQKRKADSKLQVDESWDNAVKSLLNYPEVIKKMSEDLDWTVALGEAVVADQGQVLEAVQVFRRKAQAAGNLKSDDKQVVVVEKEIIKIEPADPQVIYVPQYEPSTVVYAGYAGWGYYPYGYPSYYYPYAPGAAFAAGLVWGAAISAVWGGHYVSHWGGGGNNNINIDRSTNINVDRDSVRTDRDASRGDRASGRGTGAQTTQWKSDKKPGQVSRTVGKTPSTGRVGDAGRGGAAGGARPSTQPSRGFDGASSGARPSTQPASRGGGSAFDGYDSGRQTRMDSSRGSSSRSSMSSGASARSSGASSFQRSSGASRPSGGASRGGGGGRRR
jgi:hypothetical protein